MSFRVKSVRGQEKFSYRPANYRLFNELLYTRGLLEFQRQESRATLGNGQVAVIQFTLCLKHRFRFAALARGVMVPRTFLVSLLHYVYTYTSAHARDCLHAPTQTVTHAHTHVT
jgi:hypothetical protein